MLKLLWELVRKDLAIFVADRRSLMISFLTPIALASFIAYIMTNANKSTGIQKVGIVIADQDGSALSKDLVERIKKSSSFDASVADEAAAKSKVLKGDVSVAIVIPPDFGKLAIQAMTERKEGPPLRLLADPSKTTEVGISKGSLMGVTMQSITKQVYGDAAMTEEGKMPFKVTEENQSRPETADWSASSHAFAGMGMQGLLFWAIESAMTIMRERRMGLWRRMRASPVTPGMFVLGKAISATIRAIAILFAVFGVGMLVFHFRINPTFESYIGFGLVAVCAALMSACFGLFVAALGKNEQQSRGLSIFAVLGMCMLGGAWIPMFLMPQFMQTLSKIVPISWAINGFDDMLWRGGTLAGELPGLAVLLAFSAGFAVIALKRIKWEPEAA